VQYKPVQISQTLQRKQEINLHLKFIQHITACSKFAITVDVLSCNTLQFITSVLLLYHSICLTITKLYKMQVIYIRTRDMKLQGTVEHC